MGFPGPQSSMAKEIILNHSGNYDTWPAPLINPGCPHAMARRWMGLRDALANPIPRALDRKCIWPEWFKAREQFPLSR